MRRRAYLAGVRRAAGVGALGTLAGCSGETDTDGGPTSTRTTSAGATPAVGLTHARPDGNRVVGGRGAVPTVDPIDVPLDGTPVWLVGAGGTEHTRWLAALDDGRLAAVDVCGRAVTRPDVVPERLPDGTPPALVTTDGTARVRTPPAGASTLSHPVVVDGRRVDVDGDGALVVGNGDRYPVDALPDARLVVDDGRVLALAGATARYAHGALGDDLEASTLVRLDPAAGEVETLVDLDERVIEGTAPLATRLAGDPAVLVTEADERAGARLRAYGRDGSVVAGGAAIGRGFRWRHQLAVAPFAPDGTREVAVCKTPHIGGTVEFYRPVDGDLRIAATESGYSTHALGSRNLDGARVGDFDGDGRLELVAPTDDRTELGAVVRGADGARTAWRVPAGGRVTANLAAARRGDRTALAVGVAGGVRIWPGDEGQRT